MGHAAGGSLARAAKPCARTERGGWRCGDALQRPDRRMGRRAALGFGQPENAQHRRRGVRPDCEKQPCLPPERGAAAARKLRTVRVLRADRQPAPRGKHQRALQTPAHTRKPSRFLQPPDAEPHPFARAAKRNHGQHRQPPFFKRKARVRNRLDIGHLGRIVAA